MSCRIFHSIPLEVFLRTRRVWSSSTRPTSNHLTWWVFATLDTTLRTVFGLALIALAATVSIAWADEPLAPRLLPGVDRTAPSCCQTSGRCGRRVSRSNWATSPSMWPSIRKASSPPCSIRATDRTSSAWSISRRPKSYQRDAAEDVLRNLLHARWQIPAGERRRG